MIFFKFILISVLLYTNSYASCEIESYYQGLDSVQNINLKAYLSGLLTKTHRTISYDDLHKAYKRTDIDNTYEVDGTILDMYSENPKHKDPYSFTPGKKICGQYQNESDCYNREHLFPQGYFGGRKPMKTDIFHVYPTDGKVNNMRGSLAFGEVDKVTWKSQNGSKIGYTKSKTNKKRKRTKVFEPIDEFKGDIARAMLYFLVRYQDKIGRFKHNPFAMRSKEGMYKKHIMDLFIKWHKQDPVSDFERNRNNMACIYQQNRNPFIDFPHFVSTIWQ